MIKTQNFVQVEIVSATQLRTWLSKNYAQKEGVWLVTFKKNVPKKYIPHSDILDELICFGWIDGIMRKLDDDRVMQLITPRRVQHWSKTYKDRYAKLESLKLIEAPGRETVLVSKQNGLWNFMDDVDALIKPDDFIESLKRHQNALDNFNNFGASSQRFTLRWLKLAKTLETRSKRIQQACELASKNLKIPGT